jgi:DNA polymerase III subunit delta'
MTTRFPNWLNPAWQQLLRSWQQGRLPHAVLLTGAFGTGKHLLAHRLAALLLCQQPVAAGEACGQCAACGWLQAGSHPDLATLQPEETGKAIKIDQVRALGVELGMTSHGGRYKVAVVSPADAMNVNAANSLLKTLEEPTDRTLLILISASPGRLPATVRSRCQQLRIHAPGPGEALDWLVAGGLAPDIGRRCLQLAGGAPLEAAELAASDQLAVCDRRLAELVAVFNGRQDPLRVAADWQGEHEARALLWWQGLLQALVRRQQAGLTPAEPQMAQTLQQISESVDCRQLYELSDRLIRARNSLGSGLNRQLVLEDLLIDWARLAGRPSARAAVTGS